MTLKIKNSTLELHNADCFDVLKNIEDNSIPLIVSDPPYGISYSNKHSKSEQEWDNFTSEEYVEFLTRWLNECYRVLTENGTIWFFYGFTKIKEVLKAIDNTKFINHLENHFVYARSKGRAAKNRLKSLREECAMLTKSNKFVWNAVEYLRLVIAPYKNKNGEKRGWDYGPDGKTPMRMTGLGNVIPIFTSLKDDTENRRGTVLDIGSGSRLPLMGDIYNLQFPVVPSVLNTMEKQVHSAQKAMLILIMLVMLSSKEGNTVLDCFGGSFSTGIAAVLCSRNFIGIEKEKETFEKGVEHIKLTPYKKWEKYVKSHVASTEKGFKFGLDGHPFLPKVNI